jgi:hypothetical protein
MSEERALRRIKEPGENYMINNAIMCSSYILLEWSNLRRVCGAGHIPCVGQKYVKKLVGNPACIGGQY